MTDSSSHSSVSSCDSVLESLRELHPVRNPIVCDNVLEARRILASVQADSNVNKIKRRLAKKVLKEAEVNERRLLRTGVKGSKHYMRKRLKYKKFDQKYHMRYLYKLFRLRAKRRGQVCEIPFVIFANLKLEEKRRNTTFRFTCDEEVMTTSNTGITTCIATVVPVPLMTVFDELSTIIPEDEFPRPRTARTKDRSPSPST